MQTIEATHPADVRVTAPRRRWWQFAVVAVFAVVLGFVAGWAIRGSDSEPTALRAGGGKLTDRQEQLVERVEEYRVAWASPDPNEVLAMFTTDGRLVQDGEEFLMSDGSLEFYAETGPYTIETLTPLLVDGNTVSFVHEWSGVHYMSVMVFTSSGEPLVVSHEFTSE